MPDKPFKSGTVSAKLSTEDHELLAEVYHSLHGEDSVITFKEFLVSLLNFYKDSSYDDSSDTIQTLNNNIQELIKLNTELKHENFRLSGEISILKEKTNSDQVTENSIIIPLEPVMVHFLAIMSAAASKKANKEVTASDILKNLFWRYIVDGPGDYLPLTFTRNQIKTEIEKVRQQA